MLVHEPYKANGTQRRTKHHHIVENVIEILCKNGCKTADDI